VPAKAGLYESEVATPPTRVLVAPRAVKVMPSGLTSKITVPVGTPAPPVTVAVSVILPPIIIVVADSSVAVTEATFTGTSGLTTNGSARIPALGAVIVRIPAVDSPKIICAC